MDLNFITEMYVPVVLVACMCVGYVIKKWMPTDNKWIPTFMLVLGAVIGCVTKQAVTIEAIVAGGVTGLASTGLHQAFSQLIEGAGKNSDGGEAATEDDIEKTGDETDPDEEA